MRAFRTASFRFDAIMRAAAARRGDVVVVAVALAVLAAFAVPIFCFGGAALARERIAIRTIEAQREGLALLEREHALQAAIRALRAETMLHHRAAFAYRLAVDRALLRLGDAAGAGPFGAELAPRLAALHEAWARVPERGRTLAAIDRVLGADEEFAQGVGARAALAETSTAEISDAVALYVTLLPTLADRVDQARNLVTAAAAARRVPGGTQVAVDIFGAQARQAYEAAVAAVAHVRARGTTGVDLLGAIRRAGYARSRFQSAADDALAHPRRLRHAAGRVRDRARAFDRALGTAASLVASTARGALDRNLEAERSSLARIVWITTFAWLAGLAVAAGGALALRAQTRIRAARSRANDEARSSEVAARLAITEAQLDAVFERATVGVAILDARGTLVRVNRTLETMLDRPDAAAIGARSGPFEALLAGTLDGCTVEATPIVRDATRHIQSDFSLVRDETGRPRFAIAFVRDTTQQTATERRLRFEATHDPLSKLPNRAYLLERMRTAYCGEAVPNGVPAIAYLDIDAADAVSLGCARSADDDAVTAIAARLASAVELNTFVARFDGNAFVVLLDGLPDRAAALEAVERIIARLSVPIAVGERDLHVCVRAGIALVDRPYREPLEMIRDAELAARDAQGRGRSAARVFSPALRDGAVRRIAIAEALRHAIERDQLHLAFQPVVSSKDRGIEGFEALVRWEHPELGAVAPLDFIPIAEETGLILPIGRWVFDRACSQLAAWRTAGMDCTRLTLAINASVHEIVAPDYAPYVARTLARHGIAPGHIIIEVTESAVLESGRYAAGSLESLKALGVGLAIDDFGTGYSSMRYLLEFPFSQLKIDGSFVRGADGRLASEPIVATLVALARSVGVTTVAEGVETEWQATRLISLGVDTLQGYLFSRPVAASAIPDIVRRPRLQLIAR